MGRIRKLSVINTIINGIEFLLPFMGGVVFIIIAINKGSGDSVGNTERLSSVIHAIMGIAYIIPSLLFIPPVVTGIKANLKTKKNSFPDEHSCLQAFYRDARCKIVINSIVCFVAVMSFLSILQYSFNFFHVLILLFPLSFLYLSLCQMKEVKDELMLYKEEVVD